MFVLWKWFRWLLGFLEFDICGAYGERFITNCMKSEVELWEIRRVCPGIIRVKAYCFSRKKLDLLARKSGVSLEHQTVHGLGEVLRRYRFRWGLFFGIVLYGVLLCVLPHFIWSVEIPDADPVQALQIRRVLSEQGFGVGSFSPRVDYKELKYQLMLAFEDIAFVSVNMEGSRAVVQVRFAHASPQIQPDTPCNLVASRDGQIISILVKNGIRCVQKGQTVQKGDLLVGGIMDTRLGYYVVHADAEILARVTDVTSQTVSLTRTVTQRTGRVKVQRIWSFFGKKIAFPPRFTCPYEEYDTVTEVKHLSLGDEGIVPISLTEVYYYETQSHSREITEQEAEFFARRRLDEADRLRLCGVSVESEEETVSCDGQSVTVTRIRSLIVDICEEKEFYFEDEGR